MNRRSFIATAASAGLTTTVSSVDATAVATNEADQAYQGLFNTIDRRTQIIGDYREVKRAPDSDTIHRMHVLALMHARRWAENCGIEFAWGRPAEPRDAEYPWYCRARLNGVWLDCEPEWSFGGGDPTADRALALWAEGDIALRMMWAFATYHGDFHCNCDFHDSELGVVYSQANPTKPNADNVLNAADINAIIAKVYSESR